MNAKHRPWLCLVLLIAMCPAWAWAQTPKGAQLQMKAKLEDNLKRHDQTTRDLAATQQELVELESNLIQARDTLKQLEQKEAETAGRLLEVKPNLTRLSDEVDHGEKELAKRLRVLYLYGPDLSWWRLASARDFHDALTRSVALTRLAQNEKRHIVELNERRQKLSALRKYLSSRQDELKQIKADKLKQTDVLKDLMKQRQELMARLTDEQEASEVAIAALEEALTRLSRTFDLNAPKGPPRPVEPAKPEPEADEKGPTASPTPDQPATKSDDAEQTEHQVWVEPQSERNEVPLQGGMSPPVDGRVEGPAGPGGRGIKVVARPHAPVRSPWWGRVVYAGTLSGYGHLVVVDHGERIHTVMGYLGSISIEAGSKVKPGSVLGNLDKAGQLYLEVRKEARPQDPLKWLRLTP